MAEVRTALLEADVNYQVVKDFCDQVVAQAKGQEWKVCGVGSADNGAGP